MWVYYSKVLSYLNVSVLLADIYTMSVEHSILLFSVHHLQLTHQEVAELTRLQARNHYERVIQRHNPTMMMVSLPTCMCVCVCVCEGGKTANVYICIQSGCIQVMYLWSVLFECCWACSMRKELVMFQNLHTAMILRQSSDQSHFYKHDLLKVK